MWLWSSVQKGAAELMDHQASNKSTFLFKQIKPCFTPSNARAHPYNCVTMGSHRVSFDQFLDRMAPTLASRSRPPYIFVFRSHSPLAHKLCIPAAFNPTPVSINLSNPLCRPNPVHTYRRHTFGLRIMPAGIVVLILTVHLNSSYLPCSHG